MASGKKIVIYSTSDGQEGSLYDKMLDETSKLNQYYADKYNHTYKTFRGIKFGSRAPSALYNRFILAEEEINLGEFDWFVYLDADSYIWHMDNDFIDLMIESHSDKSFLRVLQGFEWSWFSFFAVNLKDDYQKKVISRWVECLKNDAELLLNLLTSEELRVISKDPSSVFGKIWNVYREESDMNWGEWNKNTYGIPEEYMFYNNSPFIRHVRAVHGETEELRLDAIEVDVADKLLSLGI